MARISDPKVKLAIGDPVIDELDAHGIPRHDKPLFLHIPNGHTKHAIEMIENLSPPFLVAVNNHFGVGIRPKVMALAFSSARSSL